MPALPTLRQLNYLVVLRAELNFTRAASICFVTQSTLSAGLKELESVLGIKLVERNKQSVIFTDVGQQVVARARAILTASHDLVDFVGGNSAPMTGRLQLGVIPTIAPFLLPNSLKLLREHYPQLTIGLREDQTANLLQRLEKGQLDIALIALPYDTGSLLVKPLFDEELWLVGRKGDAEVDVKKIDSLADVSDKLLLLEEGHCLRDQSLYACGRSKIASKHGIEATSLLTLVQMIEFGLGIGLIPEMAVKNGLADSPGLLTRRLSKPAPKRTIALVARNSTSRIVDMDELAKIVCRARRVKNRT